MSAPLFTVAVAALAGGLAVYIFFASKPTAYDEPRYLYPMGARVEQVSGGGARARILIAAGALMACLIFLAGAIGL